MITLKDIPVLIHELYPAFTTHQIVIFPNGYGATIITGECAYGNKIKPYELMEIQHELDIPTPIVFYSLLEYDKYKTKIHPYYIHFGDVIGNLSEKDVNDYLKEIQERDYDQ